MASETSKIDNLKMYIKNKNLPSLVLIYGKEDYFLENSVKLIRKEYVAEGCEQMDYVKINYESKGFSLDPILDNAQLPPWMSSKRVVLVRNSGIFSVADPKKELADAFEKFAKTIPESTLVVFWEDTIDKRKKAIMKVFETNGLVFESPELKEFEISDKLAGLLKRYNMTIDGEAMSSLISRIDKSMRLALNELSKILIYCQASNISHIDMSIIDLLCPPDVSGTIFVLTDTLATGNTGYALTIVDNLISNKEPIARIKFMLSKHIRQLICAKELKSQSKIVEALGVHPVTAKKLAEQAPKFSMDKLLNLYSACVKSDFDFKQGKIDERHSLDILLVMACNSLT